MPIPENASAPEIAALIGVSERRIRQMADALRITPAKRGQFPVGKLVKAALHIAGKQREPTAITDAKARALHARAEQSEMRIRQARRELIEVDEFLAVFDVTLRFITDELVGMPARVTRDPTTRRALDSEIDAIRNRVAAKLRQGDAKLRGEPMQEEDDEETTAA